MENYYLYKKSLSTKFIFKVSQVEWHIIRLNQHFPVLCEIEEIDLTFLLFFVAEPKIISFAAQITGHISEELIACTRKEVHLFPFFLQVLHVDCAGPHVFQYIDLQHISKSLFFCFHSISYLYHPLYQAV